MAAAAANLRALGASVIRTPCPKVSHVVLDGKSIGTPESKDRVRAILGEISGVINRGGELEGGGARGAEVQFVDVEWANDCVDKERYVDTEPYLLKVE